MISQAGEESVGLVDFAMIWLPAAAYFDQARTIAANKDVGNFNPAVCGVLIVCNLFRVFYWLNARFSTVLLYQSLVMIAAQLLLLKLCVSVTSKRQPSTVVYKSVSEYMSSFWAWPRYRHYAVFIASLVTTLAFLHSLIGKSPAYGDFLAAIALGIEASVPMPQAYANWRRKSTYGLSFVVLLSWFGGDAFKIGYYVQTGAPVPFLACGIVQFLVDIVICLQVLMYSVYTAVGSSHGPQSVSMN